MLLYQFYCFSIIVITAGICNPAEYCELACMQHRYLSENGEVIKYDDPMCPESWWQEVLSMGTIRPHS